MPNIPVRFTRRARTNLRKFQRILESARKRDVNESDTSVIVKDMLSDLLGYDKYEEVTTELAIRGHVLRSRNQDEGAAPLSD